MTQDQINKLEQIISDNYYIFGNKTYAYAQKIVFDINKYTSAGHKDTTDYYIEASSNRIYKVYKNGGAKEVLFEKLDKDFGNNVKFEYEHSGIFKFSNNDIVFANDSIAGKEICTRSNVDIIFDNYNMCLIVRTGSTITSDINDNTKQEKYMKTNDQNSNPATITTIPEKLYVHIIWSSSNILPIVKIDTKEERLGHLLDVEANCLYNSINDPFDIEEKEITNIANNKNIKIMSLFDKTSSILKYIEKDEIKEDDNELVVFSKTQLCTKRSLITEDNVNKYIFDVYANSNDEDSKLFTIKYNYIKDNIYYISSRLFTAGCENNKIDIENIEDMDQDFLKFCKDITEDYANIDYGNDYYDGKEYLDTKLYKFPDREVCDISVTDDILLVDPGKVKIPTIHKKYRLELINNKYITVNLMLGNDTEIYVYDFRDKSNPICLLSVYKSCRSNRTITNYRDMNGYSYNKMETIGPEYTIIEYSSPELFIKYKYTGYNKVEVIELRSVVYGSMPDYVFIKDDFGIPHKIYLEYTKEA